MKICIVTSCGGHLTEARALLPACEGHEHFYVLNDAVALPADMVGRTHIVAHFERDWRFFLNLWEAFQILRTQRPDVILSTGAGVVVPFALVGRALFGCRIIFIETITRISAPSMTGRIMRALAHETFYQWPSLAPFFPRGTLGGPLL
jgi:beta-1,4-N-acetylglucosaminyltransferase